MQALKRIENPHSLKAGSNVQSLYILVAALFATLALMFSVVALAKHNDLILSATCLVGGTLAIVTTSFFMMQRGHEQRMHKILTAMTAAEQGRAQAELASREKSRLLATMSHEIRTPLNGVIGMLGLLIETDLTAEQKNYAITANASSRTLLSIIDEILDTAKAESKHNTKRIDVELLSLVENVTELLAPRAHAKGIEISAYVAANVPEIIQSDDLRLRQILFNLAGNAIKFTEKGGISIDVVLNSKNDLVIKISDTGIGMTDEEKLRVFDEYVQANANTSKHYGGTGLGLSISRKLITGLGGKLEMTSELGQGSCFTIILPGPFAPNSKYLKALMNRNYTLAMAPTVTTHHLATNLRELGAEVTILKDAHELQMKLKSALPNTSIICDSSYAEVLKKWAEKRPRKAATRVWVMLKSEERKPLQYLLGAPFCGYLLKPLRRSTLLNLLTAQDGAALKQASLALRQITNNVKRGKALNVLLAEDNPVNTLLARTMLERLGHRVTAVGNGEAVMKLLNDGMKFDVALLDIEMPKMNGFETAKAIRAANMAARNGDALPLLALTANARAYDVRACFASGMNGHLSKPYDQLDLDEKIRSLLNAKHAA